MKRKLVKKSKYYFTYEQEENGYTSIIDIVHKNTYNGYKGVQVISYQKDVNSDGFNNAVGVRRNDLLSIPFMILHFKMFRLFGKEGD